MSVPELPFQPPRQRYVIREGLSFSPFRGRKVLSGGVACTSGFLGISPPILCVPASRPSSARPRGLTHQSEGAEHGQPLHVGQAQFHQAEGDDDTVEDVPALLEVLIGVHGDDLQYHLCCEDAGEDLWDGVGGQSTSQSLGERRAVGVPPDPHLLTEPAGPEGRGRSPEQGQAVVPTGHVCACMSEEGNGPAAGHSGYHPERDLNPSPSGFVPLG